MVRPSERMAIEEGDVKPMTMAQVRISKKFRAMDCKKGKRGDMRVDEMVVNDVRLGWADQTAAESSIVGR